MSKYIVKDVVCDSGIFVVDEFGNEELVEVCNSRANALKICEILNADLKHMVYEDSSIRELIELNSELQQKDEQLKQQLAEKDAENKKLKNIVDGVDQLKQYNVNVDEYVLINQNNVYADGNKLIVKASAQDKISLAVDKLKKLKDRLYSMQWCFTGRRNFLQEVEFMRKSQEEMIDEEIEDLLKEIVGE